MSDLNQLQEPFAEEDIEWRVQRCGNKNGNVWAIVVPYITNRAIMDRLDEVVGPLHWRNEFQPGPNGGVICGLSILDFNGVDWVTKWDGADNTDIESVKGGLSDAMKRAAVQWGIGRYLYRLKPGFANVSPHGKHSGKTPDGTFFKWDPPMVAALMNGHSNGSNGNSGHSNGSNGNSGHSNGSNGDSEPKANGVPPKMDTGVLCPECSSPMRHMKGGVTKAGKPYGEFWSCTRYPGCKGTRRASEVNGEEKPQTLWVDPSTGETVDPDTGEVSEHDEESLVREANTDLFGHAGDYDASEIPF